ncbi:hypothetical protein [Salipiger sp. PrR003]|uniref:hypothetical protein n=1 Tax=Salipiger sp. PrR003 TaxID=2706776 RepID=UPI0013DB955F|nr:hypothetical protein [Salipiger sp. PrR003]NDV52936.1 hypothetical protein [Salipiger sp. PrR003]
MPITEFQSQVLRDLSQNRSQSAYLGGGTLSSLEGSRYSQDVDYFHDTADLTLQTFEADREKLIELGYKVVPLTRPVPGFVRAVVSKHGETLKVDWAHEAAWHFFAPISDDEFGYRLHWADAATNKVLAFASRREPRDVFDVLQWHEKRLSLGALIWAASGKDAGLPPGLILDEIRRNARISPQDLSVLSVEGGLEPAEIGRKFREAIREAENLIEALPPETAGRLFLDAEGRPITPVPDDASTMLVTLAPREGGLMPMIDLGGPAFP